MAWEELSKDEKVGELIDTLTLTAVGAVEQVKANRYIDAKARITDMADRMRLDVDYWFPLVQELRQADRIPTAEEIRAKAESMVDLTSAEMRKALSDYHHEVQAR